MSHDHIWSSERLWKKAVYYIARVHDSPSDEDISALWYCLALEFLARAALTRIHPALNADPQDSGWHILYAFGIDSPRQPKSIPLHAVFSRLERIYPQFKPHKPICEYLGAHRNEELHSGSLPFVNLDEAKWLPQFYSAVQVLCDILEKELGELLGEEAEHARQLIDALQSKIKDEVKRRIAEHEKDFESRSDEEKAERRRYAIAIIGFRIWAQTKCPACESPALLQGDPVRVSRPKYEYGELLVDTTFAVTALQCGACKLHLKSMEECVAADVKPRFVVTEETDLHQMHEDEEEKEYDNM